jgi:type IV secretory pathway TrbL component
MAVKIPRGLGSASKQKGGGSEKAKADGAADGFDAASGISRDAKSKRTDAANDVRALHAVNVAIKANTAIFACKVRVRSFVIRS